MNKFAISSGGVGDALLRSAAAMKSAGNTIDETVALVAAANTIVQNPETVGTTLKTISMYLRAAKTEAEEAGESTEGMASSVSELREEILSLTGEKVDIQIDENTFKSTYQIMSELASVWDTIKDTSKANILEMIGGKRNANVVAALLENFSVAEEALGAAAKSAGSALAENEKYLDSIQGKINILKAEFESFSATLVESSLIKGVVDMASGLFQLLGWISTLIDAVGGLPTLLSVIGTIALSSSAKVTTAIGNIKYTIKDIPTFFNLLQFAGTGLMSGLKGLGRAFVDFGSSINRFAMGTGTLGGVISKTIPVVGILTTALSVGIGIYKKVREEQERASQEIKDAGKEAAKLGDEIVELSSEYIDLTEAVKDNKASKEELSAAQDKLLNKLGLERYELDELIKKYGNYEEAIKRATVAKLRDSWREARDGVRESGKSLTDATQDFWFGGLSTLEGSASIFATEDELKAVAAGLEALEREGYNILFKGKSGSLTGGVTNELYRDFSISLGDLDTPEAVLDAYEKLQDMMNVVGGINGVTDGNNFLYKTLEDAYKKIQPYADEYMASLQEADVLLAQQVIEQELLGREVPKTAASFESFREGLLRAADPMVQFITGDQSLEELVDELLRTQFGFEEFYDTVGNYNSDSIGDMVSDYQKQISGMRIAVKEFEENGAISAETYQKYFDGNEELADAIDYIDGKFVINKETIESHIAALEKETAKSMAAAGATDEQIARIHGITAALTTLLTAEDESLDQIKELQTMLNDTEDGKLFSTDEMESLLKIYPELEGCIEDAGEGYKIEEQAIRDLIKARKENIKLQLEEIAGIPEARTEFAAYTGNGQSVLNMEDIFNKYSDDINSVEDFLAKYEEFYGYSYLDENNSEIPQPLENLINGLILARDTMASYFSIIDEFGTSGYNPGYNPSDSGSNKDVETEFEKQYKLHQHYVAMEQETQEEYLRWLEGAWQAAYRTGQIEEGEQYQYEEELYEGRKELFSDYLKDTEHQIEMMRNREAGVSELIPTYKQLMSDVETQKAKYIEYGLDENSDYIQELESQWWDYRNEMLDVYGEILDNNISDYEHSISLIENNDINHERTAEIVDIYRTMQSEVHALAEEYRALGLDENSDYIQKLQQQWWDYQGELDRIREEEFERSIELGEYRIESMVQDGAAVDEIVDSWKEMLSAVNSEIEYYTSRGYSLTSEVVRKLEEKAEEFRDSIIDAIESVVQKANDLVDGFENVYSTLTTAAKEYAQNGFLSVDSLQSILELGPKYLAMLKDENGHLVINEAALQDVIKARTEEMAAETALAYAKQILIATEENDIVKLTELVSVSETAGNATWNMAYATVGLAKAIAEANGIDTSYYDTAFENLSNMQSLANTAANSISAYYKTLDESYISQKDALDKILQLTQDMIKHENDKQKEALEEQKKDYADIIDQKKEMLRLAEEQEDREKSVAEKLEKMAKLQGQIAQLSLDDSREAQAQRRSLEAELAELQKELENDQSDYALEIQEERLDKELEAYEKEKDDEIKALEDNLSSAEKLYQAAIDRIENGWDTLYDDLKSWNYEYGSTLQSELEIAWNSALKAAERYGSFVDALDGVKGYTDLGYNSAGNDETLSGNKEASSRAANDIIERMKKNSLAWFTADSDERATIEESQQSLRAEWKSTFGESLIRKSDGSWYRPGSTTPLYELDKDDVAKHIVRQMEFNADAWHTASPDERNNLAAENVELAKRLENYLGIKIKKGSDGVWYLGSVGGKELFDAYHTGGIVGGSTSLRDNEVMALLEEGEAVLDDQKKKGLFGIVDFISELSERLGTALDISRVGGILGTTSRISTGLDYADKITKESERILSKVNTGDTVYNVERMDVTAPVNVVQKLSKDEIREHAETIGSLSAEYIKEGFTKRGIKKSASLF